MLQCEVATWSEYMDCKTLGKKNKDVFYYPYDDVSKCKVSEWVYEQRRIMKEERGMCKKCGKDTRRLLKYYDMPNGRRHVYGVCSEVISSDEENKKIKCGEYIGYFSNVPNPGNVMHFGKYRGRTLRDVCKLDPGHLRWVRAIEASKNALNIVEAIDTTIYESSNSWRFREYQVPPQSFIDMMYNKYCK